MTDPATGEIIEREILEPDSDDAITRTYEEIEYRHRLCGDAYPFEVEYDDRGNLYSGYYRIMRKFEHEVRRNEPYIFYLLGLLETGIRDGLVSVQRSDTTHHELGRLFQIAACLAMGGYLRGDVVWFGFPRPERDAFLPALKRAFLRIGSHKVLEKAPAGYPQHLKDAGVDILGWLDFADGRGSRMLVFGQVASGYDWSHKTLLGCLPKFCNWFMPPPPAHIKPALLIPFPIHHQLEESSEEAWTDQAEGAVLYQASDFGVIFDRFRVARFAARACAFPEEERARIDGFGEVAGLIEWLNGILRELREEEGAT
jgi:hypothetical protein